MSASLYWMIIRNNNSFMQKRRNIGQPFSCEPNNLKGIHSWRFSGLVREKTVGITPAPGGKGVVFTRNRPTFANKPARNLLKVTLNKHPRKTLKTISNVMRNDHYRKELRMAALRKASAIMKGQKPVKPYRGRRYTKWGRKEAFLRARFIARGKQMREEEEKKREVKRQQAQEKRQVKEELKRQKAQAKEEKRQQEAQEKKRQIKLRRQQKIQAKKQQKQEQ